MTLDESDHSLKIVEHLIGANNWAKVWVLSVHNGPSFFLVEPGDSERYQIFPFTAAKNSHSKALRRALAAAEVVADISI